MENLQTLKNDLIKDTYDKFPNVIGKKLLAIRALIYAIGEDNSKIGVIEESLKWGQPSYAAENKSGTPIRLGVEKKSPGTFGLYVNCSTSLIETVKHIYSSELEYDGNRGILFNQDDDLPHDILRHVIELALTYHLD